MNRIFIKMIFTLSFLFSVFAIAYSQQGDDGKLTQEEKEVQWRMKERLPLINEQKDQGVLGERSDGYLDFVNPSRKGENQNIDSLVDDENKDRTTAYQIIANKSGDTSEHVGEVRAKHIAGKESAGHYIEANGAWVLK